MNIALLLGRIVRRLVSPLRPPRWQPVPCERGGDSAFVGSFPRVPPTFMTASEHAAWLLEERGRENVAASGGVIVGAGWVGRPGDLACFKPEMNATLVELARGRGDWEERVAAMRQQRHAAQQGPMPWEALSAEQQRSLQRARAEAGNNTCIPLRRRNWCAGHGCDLIECMARGRSS